jgi:hypothetical protein
MSRRRNPSVQCLGRGRQFSVDEEEIRRWALDTPQPYDREDDQGLYKDIHCVPEEPHTRYIEHRVEHRLSEFGHQGRLSDMGVPRYQLPK